MEIIDIAKRELSTDKPYIQVEKDLLPKGIKNLELNINPGLEKTHWWHDNMWMSGELKKEELYPKIHLKNKKALNKDYHKIYDENWLLLVVDSKPGSAFAAYNEGKWTWDSNWIFDRILVIDTWDKKSIDLF